MLDRVIAKLRKRAKGKLGNESGFTLLELLVVVAILAAIAGTATIALQDTDARAAAAAHVAMMDELNEGIRIYKRLHFGDLPNNFDSLVASTTAATLGTGALISNTAIEDVGQVPLDAALVTLLNDSGITALQYVQEDLDDGNAATPDCSDLAGIVGSRQNAFVAGNIFMTPAGNGCGAAKTLVATDVAMFWTGGTERLTGQPSTLIELALGAALPGATPDNLATATGNAYMVVGIGPASTLFDTNDIAGLTSVPVYRHVSGTEYNRFMAIFDLGFFDAGGGIAPAPLVNLVTVVDGAGDTKEEELGEWDGTRSTI